MPRINPPLCTRCGRPRLNAVACPVCVGWQADIDGIHAPFRFDGAIRQAIHEPKYNNRRVIAAFLGQWLGDYLNANPLPLYVLVPLQHNRLRESDYKQSRLLALELSIEIKEPA